MRKRIIKNERKSRLPQIFLAIIFVVPLILIVFLLDPNTIGAVPAFFLIVFLEIFFLCHVFFASNLRSVVISTAATLLLLLRYFDIGNILNLALISGVFISFGIYFWKKD